MTDRPKPTDEEVAFLAEAFDAIPQRIRDALLPDAGARSPGGELQRFQEEVMTTIIPSLSGRLEAYFTDDAALASLAAAGMRAGDPVPINPTTMQAAPGLKPDDMVRVNTSDGRHGVYRIIKVEPRAIGVEPAGNRHQRRKAHALERRKWR